MNQRIPHTEPTTNSYAAAYGYEYDGFVWFKNMYDLMQQDNEEREQYFYHGDHLGSSSWITDGSGNVNQYLAYMPFGESFIDQRSGNDIRFKFTGKERDSETGFDYFGVRYYDSDMSIWLSVDPLSDMYPSTSPFMYVMGNPIMLIDSRGESASPYYDANGKFLGTDENGFKGNIYITDQTTFDANSKDGVASSKSIQSSENTKSYASSYSNLSNEALSKIYTHALSQMKDVKVDNLLNGKVSIYDGTSKYDSKTNTTEYGYNDADPTGKFSGGMQENGQIRVTVNIDYADDLNTVEAIWSHLGVHEYNSHGVNGTSNINMNHWRAYHDQYTHHTFSKLPKSARDRIIGRTMTAMYNENPGEYSRIMSGKSHLAKRFRALQRAGKTFIY